MFIRESRETRRAQTLTLRVSGLQPGVKLFSEELLAGRRGEHVWTFLTANPLGFPRELERAVYDAQNWLDASSFKNKSEGGREEALAFSLQRRRREPPTRQMRKPVARAARPALSEAGAENGMSKS
jgi:hypothetical protein